MKKWHLGKPSCRCDTAINIGIGEGGVNLLNGLFWLSVGQNGKTLTKFRAWD
jgi:hypothetical protein